MEFGLVFCIEIIAATVKLMYNFESPNLGLYSSSYVPFPGTTTAETA